MITSTSSTQLSSTQMVPALLAEAQTNQLKYGTSAVQDCSSIMMPTKTQLTKLLSTQMDAISYQLQTILP